MGMFSSKMSQQSFCCIWPILVEEESRATKFWNYSKTAGFVVIRFVYAIGNGLISMMGAHGSTVQALAGVGGTGNSFAATMGGATANTNKTKNPAVSNFLEAHKNTLAKSLSSNNYPPARENPGEPPSNIISNKKFKASTCCII